MGYRVRDRDLDILDPALEAIAQHKECLVVSPILFDSKQVGPLGIGCCK